MAKKFHLSVVTTARNDNHGGNFLYRMQHFVDGFIEQCKRHQLKAELIIVEWNPPEETLPLSQMLKFPEDKGSCAVRFIRVPKGVHMKLNHSDKLPLFQMIGKNVGIRRALGEFVLATNIDILFSDKIIRFLRDKLKSRTLYRADRLDVPSELPSARSLHEILDFCAENHFRINGKYGTKIKIDGKWKKQTSFRERLQKNSSISQLARKLKMRFFFKVHANACGDFTLLSYKDWTNLRGYPEWEMYSWHIDEIFLYQAKQNGIKAVDLPRKMPIYHIEHGVGSGYTPEASQALFKRLEEKGIPYLHDLNLHKLVHQIFKNKERVIYNDEKWGMSRLFLEETWI